MMLLVWSRTPRRAPGVALLFGTGLVGNAIANALKSATGALTQTLPWRWHDASAHEAVALERATSKALKANPGADLAVIWAAGRSGFASDAEIMAREAAALETVLASGRRVLAAAPGRQGSLHHVSSAGGLFEGQTACGPDAIPRPLRPYGSGKLVQEEMVTTALDFVRRRIYRPSSVYGHVRGGRRGLIPVLMTAALRRVPARIVGELSTQRDYLHASDVGRYVAAMVLAPGPASLDISLLAQGRPASIFEILQLVEARIGLPLQLELDAMPDNARDTTFLRTALPSGFQPMPLTEGIARTALTLCQDHVGAAS
jgi:nucleoside-diphosphate-sugar epimerase